MSGENRKYKLPEGVRSYKELLLRYLAMDSQRPLVKILEAIKKDHGIEMSDAQASRIRSDFFLSLNKIKPLRQPHISAKVVALSNVAQVNSLQTFLEAIKAVGGIEQARKLLETLEGFYA